MMHILAVLIRECPSATNSDVDGHGAS